MAVRPLTLDEALTRVLDAGQPLPCETVPLSAASGRIAGRDLHAQHDVRPFASSAMDGVAVRAADTPGRLRLAGDVAAGAPPGVLPPGSATTIATGAALPAGADAVVRIERVELDAGSVTVPAIARGQDVRPAGDDLARGTLVISAGQILTPAHIAVLASLGTSHVLLHRRPRVVVLVTGDELATTTDRADPVANVQDVNGPYLRARLPALGAQVVEVRPVEDDADSLAEALGAAAATADLVVTTGGASIGQRDLIAEVLNRWWQGEAWQLAVRPAKPLVHGVIDDVPVLGLPGNPVAAAIAAELIVRPLLRRLGGRRRTDERSVRQLAHPLDRADDDRLHVRPGRAVVSDDGTVRVSALSAGSHQSIGLVGSEGLVLIPPGPPLAEGAAVGWLTW